MKLKQYLKELSMKADTKIDVAKKKGEYYNAEITLSNGIIWLYNAEKYLDDWDILFYEPLDSVNEPIKQKIKDKNKVALETFAAVEKLTRDFINYQKPESFRFSGQGKSRIKLYDLLAKKIIKTGNYKGKKSRGLSSDMWEFERV